MDAPFTMPCIFPVTCHTDFVGEGSTFVAIEGYADNGVRYIEDAIKKGARTIVVHSNSLLDDSLLNFISDKGIQLERVCNTRKALAHLSAQAAGNPAQKLKIIGVTGTKGKTTTTFLLEHILATAGYKTALISSVQNKIKNSIFKAPLTTPQPDYLQQFLRICLDSGVEYVVMEVAAQALSLHRVEGIAFCGVIFTNFSHEHLEFYDNLEHYFAAKCRIFSHLLPGAPALINSDNEFCAPLLEQLNLKNNFIVSYGFNSTHAVSQGLCQADVSRGINVAITYNNKKILVLCTRLFGLYNAYNILAAATMALELKIDEEIIIHALEKFAGVPGRLQQNFLPNGAQSFIDYAHNPESFQAVLSTLRELTHHLIVVFGAGGGRDKLKRPIMGVIATTIADVVIITSDNPRFEDPQAIVEDIVADISESMRAKLIQELDRKKAIEYAYMVSESGSIIALLGKGPDEYQIVGSTKHYFSERSIIEQL